MQFMHIKLYGINLEEVITILNTTSEQRRQVMELKKKLKLAKNEFKDIIQSLINIKKRLFLQNSHVDKIMDEFRDILNPQQIGNFLLWLETSKNKSNLNAFDLWGIKRIKSKTLNKDDESSCISQIDEFYKVSDTGKTKRKREFKRRYKNFNFAELGCEGTDEKAFNEGDGLIDSDYEMETNNEKNMKIDENENIKT